MKQIATIFFYFVLLAFCSNASAQTKLIDSLRRQIELTRDPVQKSYLIFNLAGQSINSDTLLPYVLLAESITRNSKNEFDKSQMAYSRAYYYIRKNYVDSALFVMDGLLQKHKNDKGHSSFYLGSLFFKAKILDRGNRYTESITALYKVIQEAELQKDTLTLIQAKTGIGWVQMEMEQYNEALQWLYKALNTSANIKFYKNYGALYSNIASTYNALGKTDSAKVYIDIAIKDARENDNLAFLATALSIQAKIFTSSKQPLLAAAPLQEIVAIRKQLNDPFYTVYDMSSLASYYAGNNQAAKGIALCKEGMALAQKSGLSSQLLMVYHALAQNYKAAGNTVEYGKTLEAIIALKDSFNNINSSKLLADMQAGSEFAKSEKTIAAQKLNLTVKNYWLFGSAIFAMMAGIIVWLAFKYYNRKQKTKMQLALAEEKNLAAQSIMDAEEQERKRIAADLHDNIGAYASAIRADVEKITNNGLGKNNTSLQNLEQHSQEIINSLRDTIWVLNKENITITGISDRIKNYISKLRPSYDHIQFQINEDIQTDVRISSQNALNIFRIVQEAIHNALKHSGAEVVGIKISSQNNIVIQITDNGKGMEENIVSNGNGLLNMQARARQTGMLLSVSSVIKEGTSLILESTTTN